MYKSQFSNDFPEDFGEYLFKNVDKYTGMFSYRERERRICVQGLGNFLMEKRIGRALLCMEMEKYEGQWLNGLVHGHEIYHSKTGEKYGRTWLFDEKSAEFSSTKQCSNNRLLAKWDTTGENPQRMLQQAHIYRKLP